MAKQLVSDELWEVVAPLIPEWPAKPNGGRPPVPDRKTLSGILFVLKTGIPWEYLPAEMDCGCGMTCWRRLHAWQEAGVWARLHQVLLERLSEAGQLDWSRASVDSASVPAKKGGPRRGRARSTGASPAPSTTSSWIARGCRSPRSWGRPTTTTR